jgi:dTMP kinase
MELWSELLNGGVIADCMTKTYPGIFISLEGPEGAGKSTQLKILSKQLEAVGYKHVLTRDPGGTGLGKQIRRIVLNPDNQIEKIAELLLYQADRAQNVAEVIKPALEQGHVVFCDRYTDSTLAYQGYGRGMSLELIEQLNAVATSGLKPELTVLFDLPSEEGLARLHPGSQDRLEREALEFHQRIRQGYKQLIETEPERWQVLDASKPLTTVQAEFKKLIAEKLKVKLD